MQIDDAATILAGADFFEICTEEERRLLAFASERKRFAAGSTIVESGVVPDGAHVLISGSISVTPGAGGEPHIVSEHGAVISTMALIVARPREVTIRAVGAVEHVIPLARGGLPRERVAQPGTAARLDADAQTAIRDAVLQGHLADELPGVVADLECRLFVRLEHWNPARPLSTTRRVLF